MVSSAIYDITGGDPVQMAALIDEFKTGIAKSIGLMKGSETDYDWREAAHRLKGGALAIGADRLAAAAAEAEHGEGTRETYLASIEEAFAQEFPD